MTQYLKVWQGVTSGTLAGRDDGYPETKYSVFETIDKLVAYPVRKDEEIFSVSAVDPNTFPQQLADAKQRVEQQRRQQELTREQAKLAEQQAKVNALQQGQP